ncbi:MAG: undecaprenyl-diphosphate phosphatase [Candidatus Omnitrophota bacterium]
MTIAEAIISGIVQGVTEFLPVSSSGHLVFLHKLFGLNEPTLHFDICLHAATLLAVVSYFRKDISRLVNEKNTRYLIFIIIAAIPAVVVGVLFEQYITMFFMSPKRTAAMLLFTSFVLFLGQIVSRKRVESGKTLTVRSSFAIGAAQAVALLPGVSRSGMTITAGLFSGIKAEEAFRFSFLLSIPVILGALVYKLLTSGFCDLSGNIAQYASGMVFAFITGIVSLFLLWKAMRHKYLFVFAVYCLMLGIAGLLFF